jgi:hypothetical protein
VFSRLAGSWAARAAGVVEVAALILLTAFPTTRAVSRVIAVNRIW